jgi:putative SOS response-associated peptidase YedK
MPATRPPRHRMPRPACDAAPAPALLVQNPAMCVNYRPATRETIRVDFNLEPPAFAYAAEVFAGHLAPILVAPPAAHGPSVPVWREAMFGLVPHWAKSTAIARQTYNARAETVADKPSYRTPWRRRQFCLVPMQCFFEPNYESGRAVRWSIARTDGQPFAAAALWDAWESPEGRRMYSFSMLTVNADAHPLMARFHKPGDEKRSLVVVPRAAWTDWLTADPDGARALLSGPSPESFQGMAAPPARAGRTATAATSGDLFGSS